MLKEPVVHDNVKRRYERPATFAFIGLVIGIIMVILSIIEDFLHDGDDGDCKK